MSYQISILTPKNPLSGDLAVDQKDQLVGIGMTHIEYQGSGERSGDGRLVLYWSVHCNKRTLMMAALKIPELTIL